MPGSSSSGNMRPQSTAIRSSPLSTSIMLRPISPSPPRGMRRTEGSTKTPFLTVGSSYHPARVRPKFPGILSPGWRTDAQGQKGISRDRSPTSARAGAYVYRRLPTVARDSRRGQGCAGSRGEVVRRAGPVALERRGVGEPVERLPGIGEEARALGARERLARDELLAHRVHELAVLRDAVVEVRPGGEPRHADVADDVPLAHARAAANAGGELREVVVHGRVARAVADRDRDAIAAVPAGRGDDAVGHGAHGGARRRRVVDREVRAHAAEDRVRARV